MAKSKYQKIIDAFEEADLNDQIAAYKEAGRILSQNIDKRRSELSTEINELESVKESIQ